MDNVIVYSAPNCYKCEQLKSKLKQKGVEFNEINVKDSVNSETLSLLKEKGFRELPVVGYNNELLTKTQFEVNL